MGQIIYVVTAGSYSDYHIEALFDGKEKADAFIAYQRALASGGFYEQPQIEEWALNQFYDPIARGLTCFHVYFEDIHSGDVTRCDTYYLEEDGWEISNVHHQTGQRWYQTSVWTTHQESALKIANERRARYLVEHPEVE